MSWMRNAPGVAGTWAVLLALAGGAWVTPARAGSLVFDSRADWQQWTFPRGTLQLTEEGSVFPQYYRKNINACLDATEFTIVDKTGQEHVGGLRGAGSNAHLAGRIIDGDVTTSWGPRRSDDPEKWYVEIDLGRLVTATKIILRFAEDADPFEEFKVFTSDGTPAFVSAAVAEAPDYRTAASVTKPNREMVLEYPLRDGYNIDVRHRSVRYLYVLMTAWRDPAATPRLAELEVISLGDNIVSATLERGGDIKGYSAGGVVAPLIDGDGSTFWESTRWSVFPEAHWYFHLDLGARFWLDTIVLIAYPPSIIASNVTAPIHHRLEVSDGVPLPGIAEAWEAKGPYLWTLVDHVTQNPPPGSERPLYVLDTEFSPRQVRRVFYDHLTPKGIGAGRIRVREVQAYGQGFVPSAALRSEFVDLGRPLSLASVQWEADMPPGTSVEIRTRTGNGIVEEVLYHTADGQEVRDKNKSGTSQDEYDKLPPFLRGEVDTLIKADETWSGWSQVYEQSGDPFLSPSPRRYLQTEAVLGSSVPEAAASLDRIELSYFDPLARSVVGEISPPEIEAPAVPQEFSLYILPTFEPRSRGFDEVLIRTPSQAEVLGVVVGGVSVEPDSIYTSSDSLWIHLPLVRRQANPLVEVQFRCTVYLNGTPFDTFLGLSSQPEARQRVDGGEAYDGVDSQRIVVGVPVEHKLLDWSDSPPALFTPNGDGLNDELVFDFVVYKINAARPLGVRVYGLQGTLVRELRELGSSGRHRLAWDGRDEADQQVPPGLYVGQVFVDGAEADAVLNRVIAVVY